MADRNLGHFACRTEVRAAKSLKLRAHTHPWLETVIKLAMHGVNFIFIKEEFQPKVLLEKNSPGAIF